MIAGVRSSAGLALLDTNGGPPCLECLITRLREAGFAVNDTPADPEPGALPPPIREALRRTARQWAPVALLRGDSASRHVLLPYPGCAACGEKQGGGRASLAALRDPLLGITSLIERRDPRRDPGALCFAVTGRVHLPAGAEPEYAEGTGPDARSALRPQLAEAVERYAAFHPLPGRLVRARANQIGCPPVRLFGGYDARQLARTGYVRLRSSDHLSWIRGRRLADGQETFVPAASVFLHRKWPEEPRFAPLMSTGTASHRSVEAARLRAALEALERYGTLCAWNAGDFGRRLPDTALPDSCADLLDRVRRNRLELLLRVVTRPPRAPVALAAVSGPRYPWIAFGAGAGLDTARAAEKAAREAALSWQLVREWSGGLPDGEALAPVERPSNHMLHAAREKVRRRLLPLMSAGPAVLGRGRRLDEAAVMRELLALCPHAVQVDLTPPDCRMCGFAVVKIVTPGLPTLSFGTAGAPALFLKAHAIPRTRRLHPFG